MLCYREKNNSSEFPSKYFFLDLELCLQHHFHNLFNGDNLQVIIKIPSVVFMNSAKMITWNPGSELRILK